MADTAQPAGSATTASAAAQGGTAAAGSVPSVEDLQRQLAEAQAKATAETKRAEDSVRMHAEAQKKIGSMSQEVHRARQVLSQQQTSSGSLEAQTEPDPWQQQAALNQVLAFRTDPRFKDYMEHAETMEKVLTDPANEAIVNTMDIWNRQVWAITQARSLAEQVKVQATMSEAEKLRTELAAEREKTKKFEESRQALAGQAVVSGAGAALPLENITPEELRKMTTAEMEAKFGKANLLQGLV